MVIRQPGSPAGAPRTAMSPPILIRHAPYCRQLIGDPLRRPAFGDPAEVKRAARRQADFLRSGGAAGSSCQSPTVPALPDCATSMLFEAAVVAAGDQRWEHERVIQPIGEARSLLGSRDVFDRAPHLRASTDRHMH